jgi:hypothetical protein
MDNKKSNKLNKSKKMLMSNKFISFFTFMILINKSICELIIKSPSSLVEEFKSKK